MSSSNSNADSSALPPTSHPAGPVPLVDGGRPESSADQGSAQATPEESSAAPPTSRVILTVLQRQLLDIITAGGDKEETFAETLKLVLSLTNSAGVVYFQRDTNGQLVLGFRQWNYWFSPSDSLQRKLLAWSNQACDDDAIQLNHVDTNQDLVAASIPVILQECPSEALCVVLLGLENLEYYVAVAQLVAGYLTLWNYLDTAGRPDQETRNAAVLVDLLSRLQAYEQVEPACYRLVNELESFLDCQRVAIGLKGHRAGRWRLQAISRMADFDRRAEIVRSIEAVMYEATVRDAFTVFQADEPTREATLAHQKLAALTAAATIVSSPLRDSQGEIIGVWVFIGDAVFGRDKGRINMIRAAAPHVATCLEFVIRHQRNRLWRLGHKLRQNRRALGMRLAVAGLLLVIGLLLFPFPYKMSCNAKLQPVTRRFVAAPFDGILERTLVEPGDVVTADQCLARLDGREIRWELAGLLAEHDRAVTEYQVALAEKESAASRLAKLKRQRLELKIKLLQHRERNLDIKGPIDGVVISGDLKKAEGVPVSIGQTLFEIGPLDRMLVEVAIPDAEISYVQPGCRVELRLDADPGTVREAELVRIHPRAEVVGHENVFIAEALLDNPSGFLRPGMNGRATVIGPRRPLAWNLFHKPWQYLAQSIGG